jgi:hypothetical protein
MPEDDVRSRLIPQFSIRWLFALTTIAAVAFSILGLAVRGSGWAVAVSFGMASLAVLILTYALVFAAVWIFSVVCGRFVVSRGRAGHSPFGPRPGSAAKTESPFAPADNVQVGDLPITAAVEAVLVERAEEPAAPGPRGGLVGEGSE